MLSPGKMIYTQRFPQPEFEDELDEDIWEKVEAFKETPLWASFKEYLRALEESRVYVAKPEKLEGRQQFIDLAERLSQEHKVNMDICEHEDRISVVLHLYSSIYEGEAKDKICTLMKMCDSVSFLRTLTGPFDIKILLDYMTHDCSV